MIKANLGDLDDIDLTTKLPSDKDLLSYDGTQSKWVPRLSEAAAADSFGYSYMIDLNRWGIKNDGTAAEATTKGINDAIIWAKSQNYNHVILPGGIYLLKPDPATLSCIVMKSGMHFEMVEGCQLQLETNSSPYYRMMDVTGVKNAKISGGILIGDKKTHQYQMEVGFVRGGVNPDGSLNNDPNFIRSNVIDRYQHPGLLRKFRLSSINGVSATQYSFYQYKDTVSSDTLVGFRNNGGFAPASPTGRGWFGPIEAANKMIFVIDISSSPLSDAQIAQLQGKVDSQDYTHEWGEGIEIKGSNQVDIDHVEISDCTGDAVSTGWLQYQPNPADYTQEQMGSHIYIHDCDLHHCRRQGVTLGGSDDIYVFNNKIHHIGFAADNTTIDGTAPMFGIDIESMWSQTNIPTWRPELNQQGLELNTRIYIYRNYIHHNVRGHLVNADGIHAVLEDNTFEGWNVGGISSYRTNMYVKYLDNTFIGCELVVEGDNMVHGAVCNNGNIKLLDVAGAFISDCHITNGKFYGSSVYGYFGTPAVDVATGTFSYSSPHGMGNGAKITFEQWVGKVPAGINPDKLYYTVNITPTSFQVSETKGGAPVAITDAGEKGFNISRYDYGRCYISNITVEREWRNDNALTPNFSVLLTGGVLKNITVKNYEANIQAPKDYAGRPITVDGFTVIEGGANLDACNINNGKFIRVKTGILGGDINLTTLQNSRRIYAGDCLFQNVGVNFGNVILQNSTFLNALIQKPSSQDSLFSVLANCYMEHTRIYLHWLTTNKAMIIAKCVFDQVTTDINANTKMVDNLDLNSIT